MGLPRNADLTPVILQKMNDMRDVRQHEKDEEEMLTDPLVGFQFGKILGAGTFGKVYEAMNTKTGHMVAVKSLELKSGRAEQIMAAAQIEIDMMKRLRHCFSPSTIVVFADGRIKPASDVVAGDVLLGDGGSSALVKQVQLDLPPAPLWRINTTAGAFDVTANHQLTLSCRSNPYIQLMALTARDLSLPGVGHSTHYLRVTFWLVRDGALKQQSRHIKVALIDDGSASSSSAAAAAPDSSGEEIANADLDAADEAARLQDALYETAEAVPPASSAAAAASSSASSLPASTLAKQRGQWEDALAVVLRLERDWGIAPRKDGALTDEASFERAASPACQPAAGKAKRKAMSEKTKEASVVDRFMGLYGSADLPSIKSVSATVGLSLTAGRKVAADHGLTRPHGGMVATVAAEWQTKVAAIRAKFREDNELSEDEEDGEEDVGMDVPAGLKRLAIRTNAQPTQEQARKVCALLTARNAPLTSKDSKSPCINMSYTQLKTGTTYQLNFKPRVKDGAQGVRTVGWLHDGATGPGHQASGTREQLMSFGRELLAAVKKELASAPVATRMLLKGDLFELTVDAFNEALATYSRLLLRFTSLKVKRSVAPQAVAEVVASSAAAAAGVTLSVSHVSNVANTVALAQLVSDNVHTECTLVSVAPGQYVSVAEATQLGAQVKCGYMLHNPLQIEYASYMDDKNQKATTFVHLEDVVRQLEIKSGLADAVFITELNPIASKTNEMVSTLKEYNAVCVSSMLTVLSLKLTRWVAFGRFSRHRWQKDGPTLESEEMGIQVTASGQGTEHGVKTMHLTYEVDGESCKTVIFFAPHPCIPAHLDHVAVALALAHGVHLDAIKERAAKLKESVLAPFTEKPVLLEGEHKIVNIEIVDGSKRFVVLPNVKSDHGVLTHNSNVVGIKGSIRDGNTLNIIMELVAGRSIADLLISLGQPFCEPVIVKLTRQLLLALQYCHLNRCVHRDIKGKNILLTTDGTAKLCDFGSAKVREESIDKDAVSGTYSYTPLWVAPETLSRKQYNEKMASGKDPWSEMNFQNAYQALYHIGSSDQIPRIPQALSEAAQDFTRCCLTRDPDQRPSAAQLLKHRWITGAGSDAGSNPLNHSQESARTDGLRPTLSNGNGNSGGAKTAAAQLEQLALMVDSKLATQPLHATLAPNPAAPVIHGAARVAVPAPAAAPAAGDDWIPPPPPPDAEGGPEDRRSAGAPGGGAAGAPSPFSHSGAAAAILQPSALRYSNGFNMQYFPPMASSVASHNSSGSRIHHYPQQQPRDAELHFGSSESDSSASMSACSSLNSSVVSFVEGWDGPLSPPPSKAAH